MKMNFNATIKLALLKEFGFLDAHSEIHPENLDDEHLPVLSYLLKDVKDIHKHWTVIFTAHRSDLKDLEAKLCARIKKEEDTSARKEELATAYHALIQVRMNLISNLQTVRKKALGMSKLEGRIEKFRASREMGRKEWGWVEEIDEESEDTTVVGDE